MSTEQTTDTTEATEEQYMAEVCILNEQVD